MNYIINNLKKVHEFEYNKNSMKKKQIKPIFIDLKTGEEWVGKSYNRVYSANERIAYDLSQIINLPSVKIPEIKLGKYENQIWCLSKKINVKYHFRKQNEFSELNEDESQALILNRMMGNVDGNMANLLKDFNNQFWLIDFEYSGHFKNYDERFLINDRSRAKSILLAYMGYDKKNRNFFDNGIECVVKALDSKDLSKNNLIEIGINAGLNSDESKFYANNIMNNAFNIEKNMHLIIDVWNNVLQEKYLKRSYKELVISKGARCAHACIIMTEKYLGIKEHTFQELDEILSVNRKKQIIFPVQIAKYFVGQGRDVEFFIDEKKVKDFLENPKKSLIEKFGLETGNEIFTNSNIDIIQSDLSLMLNNGLVKKENPNLEYLLDKENKDNAIISTIDLGKIYDLQDFNGHHVFITGIGNHNIFYNDPGPKNAKKNQKAKINEFLKAVDSASLFDYGHIIIS